MEHLNILFIYFCSNSFGIRSFRLPRDIDRESLGFLSFYGFFYYLFLWRWKCLVGWVNYWREQYDCNSIWLLRQALRIDETKMTSTSVEEETSRGSMWELDKRLDQPMDEEAGKLRNVYRVKVPTLISFFFSPHTIQFNTDWGRIFALLGNYKNLLFFQKSSMLVLMRLAFQSLGVVFGDLGTSPLYVFYNTFPYGVDDREELIEALSLIIYSLTLVVLIKYVFVVLRANDNGQGIIIK